MDRTFADRSTIETEINRIRSLGIDELRTLWRGTFGVMPPPALTKDLLGRMITYRFQEEAFGGLDRDTRRLLDSLARGEKPIRRRLKAGTVLVREYQGQRHTVTVVTDGFIWRETTYPSLSKIACAITGTAWNGPRFFGLRVVGDDRDEFERRKTGTDRTAKQAHQPRPKGRAVAVPPRAISR